MRWLNDGRSPGFSVATPSRRDKNRDSGKGEVAISAVADWITVAGTAPVFHGIPF